MMPPQRWCGCIPLPCQHNITAGMQMLSKHKMWEENMQKCYHIWIIMTVLYLWCGNMAKDRIFG